MTDPRFDGRPPPPPLDLIDADDRIIGQLDYLTIHQQGLLHRYVQGVVVSSTGQILLQKRSLKNRNYPQTWDASIGEHVDAGESYASAVLREAMEEIGLALTQADLIPLGRISNIDPPIETMLGQLFVIRHDGPFQIDPHEVEEVRWTDAASCFASFARAPADFCKNFHASLHLIEAWLKEHV